MTGLPALRTIVSGSPDLPPAQALQRILYRSIPILAAVLTGLTVWYAERIPAKLLAEARESLSHRPWLQTQVTIHGRTLILQGETEPLAGFARDIDALEAIRGVRTVSNRLKVIPRPSPDIKLHWSHRQIHLDGHLTGIDLDRLLYRVQAAFPSLSIQDHIRIDDFRGHLVWLDFLGPMLAELSALETFTLSGTRHQLRVEGHGETPSRVESRLQELSGKMDPAMIMSFRLWPSPEQAQPKLSLVSNRHGTWLDLVMEDRKVAHEIHRALIDSRAFGRKAIAHLTFRATVYTPEWFRQLPGLFPLLGQIRDLRMVSSGQQLWLWGQVHDEDVLGRVESALQERKLSDRVVSRLQVQPADKTIELSVFLYPKKAILSGRLPNSASKSVIVDQLQRDLRPQSVEDHVILDPKVSGNPWSIHWHTLRPHLPATPFGLSILADSVLLTGQVDSPDAYENLIHAVANLLPGKTLIDWLALQAQD